MSRSDIYLLNSPAFSTQLDVCCKLTEKAFQQGMKIHIQTREGFQNEALNERLWNFRSDSFLPHAVGQSHSEQHPITIDITSATHSEAAHRDLLVLLAPELPPQAEHFARIAIVVPAEEQDVQRARAAYRTLTQKGWQVNIHDFR